MIGMIAKAIIAAAVAAGSAVTTALQDGHIQGLEWVAIIIAFLAGFGAVLGTANLPGGWRFYSKAIVAALIAGLSALGTALINGWPPSGDEIVVIILAIISGSGLVYITPNAPASTDIPPRHAA
jgi:hypothetical protein